MGFREGLLVGTNCNIVAMQIAREMVIVVNLREVAAALVMQLLSPSPNRNGDNPDGTRNSSSSHYCLTQEHIVNVSLFVCRGK